MYLPAAETYWYVSPAQLLEINIDCRTREAGMINPGRSEEALTIDSPASHTLLPHTQARSINTIVACAHFTNNL